MTGHLGRCGFLGERRNTSEAKMRRCTVSAWIVLLGFFTTSLNVFTVEKRDWFTRKLQELGFGLLMKALRVPKDWKSSLERFLESKAVCGMEFCCVRMFVF